MAMFTRLMAVGALCAGLGGPALSAADPFSREPSVDYSAVRDITSSEGSVSMKEYYADGDRRLEMNMDGMTAVVLDSKQQGKSYMLMPEMKMYMEMPSARLARQTGDVEVIEQKKVGSETINGLKVDKYQSVFKDASGNEGKGYYWVTKEDIVVKVDMTVVSGGKERAFLMQLNDLRIADQPASLFSLPKGYTAAPAMGGMPGMPR